MEEDDETKRLNERRRIREERRKKQEEDEKKEEQARKQREDERKLRKEQRNKERGEREEKQKKELEDYIKRSEDERKQRREERERRRVDEERLAKEEEEKRRKLLEERERKRREEDEEKKRKIKELEESRKRILKELEEEDNNSQVESILSLKKKRLAIRQKIETILSAINPSNNQYTKAGVTIEGFAEPTKGDESVIGLLLTDELKEEVIDLVASGFRTLIDYLSQPSSLATMVEFLIDIQVGAKVFNAKQDIMNGTASIEIKNWLARMQASYEILKGGIPIIAKIITDPVNSSVLDILFSMISNPPPISLTNMHIFTDLVTSFMSRKPEMLIYICDNKDTILPSFMQHLSSSETVDLLLKMAEVEMTQFNENSSSSSSSAASSFFSLFTGSSSSNSSSSSNNNNKEKPHWTSELTPYLILRINEICNLDNVIMDQLDLEIDNICRLMSELIKKYPKSKVAHHLCGQSFSNAVLRNGFKLVLSLPYSSPVSSSMLTLMCTLIDSSIAMTQLTSSSTSAPEHPSVINHLFKQIVVVDIPGTDGETRELSPIKAIYEVLNIKDYSEPFNVVRLKSLHLVNSMIKANILKLDREIWESGILKKTIDIFFEYEANNVIHCMVESFLTPLIQRCLGSDDEEFMCHLLKDCSFISRVVNILNGGNSKNPMNSSNSSISSNNSNSNSIGSISSSSGSGVANRLTALFVNTKDEPEPPKSEPVIGAPAPAIGSLSRGGGKKIRRKVSFFGGGEEEENNSNGTNENSNGDLKLAVGDLSTFLPNESKINVEQEETTIEKKNSNGSISASISSSSSSSSSSLLKRTLSSSSSSSSDKKKEKEKEKELKELEKMKQKEKEKELLEMLKSQKLSSDQEKEMKAQRKQEKKERKQKREEKKLAKRLKEKERENKEKSKSKSASSTISLVSNAINKDKRSSTSLTSSQLASINSNSGTNNNSNVITTTTNTTTTTTTTTTNTTTTTTTTTTKQPVSDQSSDTSSDSGSSIDVSKLSLNDLDSNCSSNNNDESNINIEDIESIESIEEQSIVVVYHENDKESNINNNESCNNSNSNNIKSENIIDNNNNNNSNNIKVEKKRVNHNVGHIISLCIEITHIVNKSKNQLLRDIVDECCSFQGQWDEVVVPKLKQEISHRSVKPIGTVSMRKGRKGGPPTPFTNVEYFPNTANGVPIPPTETTSKFFF
ncbi:hypothetical protein DICPUDRAFT_95857 [Dictyostelium purpureum]|uniref:Uncharacterized protein n=1 Tax=Dictyostelium purpureum TaxID=5786 RepID=F1A1P5_DICPU|nr:uncharacterized protein DICPUDRAFT_95857 [Dictyostelium purpureum]EGC29882.1 hypothetical protein DICPUDRAFT_95857 [Dictyostelium purpureum]|eukprot:XP_003293589.1 hypothetical protein DICPUDRAFT_95857 [Dictyostelium purpureum]